MNRLIRLAQVGINELLKTVSMVADAMTAQRTTEAYLDGHADGKKSHCPDCPRRTTK